MIYVLFGHRTSLTAFCRDGNFEKSRIIIGNRCVFGADCHITAVNQIKIGNSLRTGNSVLISDNAHGDPRNSEHLKMHPDDRPIFSKGGISIGNNVWIGEKAAIMAGVKIGDGAIIGANAVVTHDIAEGGIAVGCPAKEINKKI